MSILRHSLLLLTDEVHTPSASVSATQSPTRSASISATQSPSSSPSPSPPPLTSGSTCWGHDTGVVETNVRDFSGNWTGTGEVENSGDAERIALNSGEYMESEIVDTGAVNVELLQNNYQAGDTVTLKYRHGVSDVACQAAAWSNYTGIFLSLGYVQIRIEA